MVDGSRPPLNSYGVPASLDDWTFDTILGLVRRYQFEPEFFDFKAVVNSKDASGAHTQGIRKAAASFANTHGGYLVFGVKDRAADHDASPEDRIEGIPTTSDVHKEFQNKVDAIQPALRFEPSPLIRIPTTPVRGVVVVHVPRSVNGPHMADDAFWVRGPGGSARRMLYWEIGRAFSMSNERRRQIVLLTDLLQSFQAQLKQIRSAKTLLLASQRFDTALLGSLIVPAIDPFGELPVGAALLKVKSSAEQINGVLDRHQLHRAGNPAWAEHQFGMAKAELLQAIEASERMLAESMDEGVSRPGTSRRTKST